MQDPYDEGDQAIPQARGVLRVCVGMAADEGLLQTIGADRKAYACRLALGVLSQYIMRNQITLVMIERWLDEAIASAAAKGQGERNDGK
jgi:hypothetical protein